jgi:aspartyl-tRNA(Asn)/glutamyl-tRNA(Gln) amidotransferase subunit A
MHEFAYGITSENPHFGAVRNPWALERISGGSSGGSAAAVAAGLCVAAVGTDTGGSIRVPSSLCGVVGLKPSFGRISVHGVVPLAPSFDHVGAIARSTHDTAALLNVLAGRDPFDPTSISGAHGDFVVGLRRTLRKMRLGRPREHYWTQLDPDVKKTCEAAVAGLVKHGARVEEVSLPSLPSAVDAANVVALVEATEVHTKAGWFPARGVEYGADVAARLEQGREVRALEYLRAREILQRSRMEFEAALARVDVLIAPTTAIPAPAIGAETVRVGNEEESVRSALVRLNRPANFMGLPAISVPCGFTRAGLPVGLQLIGRSLDEGAILAIARFYEQEHDWQAEHPSLS